MSDEDPFDITIMIEDLFEQIYDLQDFIRYNGIDEQDFIQWQNDKDNITYH